VSELTTNAVVHADPAPAVNASLHSGHLLVEVHDQGLTPPHTRDQLNAQDVWG
jgi:anti-sigma regulatory factor (Ser/Thr protein kinase)